MFGYMDKNQEGLVTITADLTKDSDIVAGISTIYTMPAGYRPLASASGASILLNIYNAGAGSVPGSFTNIGVNTSGSLQIYPVVSTNLSGARRLYNFVSQSR